MTVRPSAVFWVLSKTAEQAVQIMNDINMPTADQRNRVRRPNLLTSNAAPRATIKLKAFSNPFISVWVSVSVTPTVSKTSVK